MYYVSDFGTLEVVPNRFQREHSSDFCDVFVLDFEHIEISYLDGYKQETISKVGDAERRRLLVDYCLTVKNPVSQGIYADVDDDVAMTAS